MKLNKLRILVCALIVLSGILQCLWGQGPSSAKTHVGTKPHKKPAGKPAGACEICGVERWDIRTLSDSGASSVDFSPVTKTVAELTSEPAPNDPSKRNLAEQRTYQVRARLVGYKQEFNPASTAKSHGDHDFHIVLADLNDPSKTMIVESKHHRSNHMEIKRAGSQPSAKCPSDWFTGTVPHRSAVRGA